MDKAKDTKPFKRLHPNEIFSAFAPFTILANAAQTAFDELAKGLPESNRLPLPELSLSLDTWELMRELFSGLEPNTRAELLGTIYWITHGLYDSRKRASESAKKVPSLEKVRKARAALLRASNALRDVIEDDAARPFLEAALKDHSRALRIVDSALPGEAARRLNYEELRNALAATKPSLSENALTELVQEADFLALKRVDDITNEFLIVTKRLDARIPSKATGGRHVDYPGHEHIQTVALYIAVACGNAFVVGASPGGDFARLIDALMRDVAHALNEPELGIEAIQTKIKLALQEKQSP